MLSKLFFITVTLFITTQSHSINFFDEIPKGCFDPNGGYSPNKPPSDGDLDDSTNIIQIGENGFIEYDFNNDEKPDYVFSEKENSPSKYYAKHQLVLCLSSSRETSIFDRSVFKNNSQDQVKLHNGIILLSRKTTEHNYGYYGHFEEYQYDPTFKTLALIAKFTEHRTASCCDEAYCKNYDFIKKRYKEATECDPNMYSNADGTTTREVCEDTLIEGTIIKNTDGSYKYSPTKESVLKNYSPEACSFEPNKKKTSS